jgi:AraC family transcriptional regulator of adaptative response/methylated-DNA-[protein]-cysteine methyltransferase
MSTEATWAPNVAYDAVAQAIMFIRHNAPHQPGLAEVARHVGYSEAHFQRLFSQWAGVSPTRFLQFLTKEHARTLLTLSHSVQDAALDAGLSGPGRLHDLMVTWEAMTPGEIRRQGEGVAIDWGVAPSPLGWMVVGETSRGICHLSFVDDPDMPAILDRLRQYWPRATLRHRAETAATLVERLFAGTSMDRRLHLLLRGSPFRLKVWEALLRVPPGQVCSYTALAARAGVPRAARAVGSAMAGNEIALLIPCHRVIRETGEIGEYRWGATRKTLLLGWEQARRAGRQGGD